MFTGGGDRRYGGADIGHAIVSRSVFTGLRQAVLEMKNFLKRLWCSGTMKQTMFSGAMTAMVTPFHNGKLDEDRLRQQVEFQIRGGINGLVPVGPPAVSHAEFRRTPEGDRIHGQARRGRVPVIAGTGANATSEALELHFAAKKLGATRA